MTNMAAIKRDHVVQAVFECDRLGTPVFLREYGFRTSQGYDLVHEGRDYPSKAIVGVAHRYATGKLASSRSFDGGKRGAARILRDLGFTVTDPTDDAVALTET